MAAKVVRPLRRIPMECMWTALLRVLLSYLQQVVSFGLSFQQRLQACRPLGASCAAISIDRQILCRILVILDGAFWRACWGSLA